MRTGFDGGPGGAVGVGGVWIVVFVVVWVAVLIKAWLRRGPPLSEDRACGYVGDYISTRRPPNRPTKLARDRAHDGD